VTDNIINMLLLPGPERTCGRDVRRRVFDEIRIPSRSGVRPAPVLGETCGCANGPARRESEGATAATVHRSPSHGRGQPHGHGRGQGHEQGPGQGVSADKVIELLNRLQTRLPRLL
jgi:hypothetical protein